MPPLLTFIPLTPSGLRLPLSATRLLPRMQASLSTTPTPDLKSSRKAVAIALNYAAHAAEMRSRATHDIPVYFFKPSTSYLAPSTGPILLPDDAVVHHEVELGVIIGASARKVRVEDALAHVAGFVCAIDVTARNWQTVAKERGRPWALAKGCDTFLPYSEVVGKEAVSFDKDGVADVELWLRVNGELRQRGSTRDMIWTVPELIANISRHCTLEENDLILTGTPEGVGQIRAGDVVTAGIEGIVDMSVDVVATSDPQ